MRDNTLEKQLTSLGFSMYEARAYMALVRDNPLTGYELAKKSGIPRSKVYECLERLERKRIVIPVEDNPARYVGVPPGELVRRLSTEFETSVRELEARLMKEGSDDSVDYIYNVTGYRHIIDKAAEIIGRAAGRLDISLWGEEWRELKAPAEEAVNRGVRVRILAFNGVETSGGEVYHHPPLADTEGGSRWITIVADNAESLTGQCSGESVVAAWTRNPCVVFVSGKYIEHEILKITGT